MLRFIASAIFLVTFLIIAIPLLLVEWIIGLFSKNVKAYSSLRIVQWAFKVLIKICGIQVTIIGEEHIPDEAVLFVGNHRSIFDTVLTYSRVKRLTGYVAKDSMEKTPLFSAWMRNLNCLFLNRDNPKEGLKTILQAIEYIKAGISICIFPEGGRNKGEELTMLPFKAGAFKVSTKTNCAIIPMSINNAIGIFEQQFPRVKKTHVVIEYGKPIYPNDLEPENKKQIGAYVQNIIQETIQKNSALIE
ncbi:MAG: 1-acyl-sn-glycerol-3-phosphate acyltransferase [Lachnospiraceae bacterium]|nr:1-acyl-sn-glycerol-3-phosphate acyltransferase [Lachnospiraceae bacterium]